MHNERKETMTVKIPQRIGERIDAVIAFTGRTKGEFVGDALDWFLRLPDVEQERVLHETERT